MLTAIEGIYENGQIILKEKPEHIAKARVIVVFREEKVSEAKNIPTKRSFGISRGAFTLSNAFDEPLDDLKDSM